MVDREKLLERFGLWRKDIVLFVRDVFGVEPTWQQRLILESVVVPGSKTSVSSGHGTGKSSSAAWVAIWHVLLFHESRALATAPSSAQLRDVLMAEIAKWVSRANPWIKDQLVVTSMGLSLKGSEKIQFLTARTADETEPSSLQGLHAEHMLVIVDESFGVHRNVYEVLKGALTTPHGRAIMLGNATTNVGYAYDSIFGKSKDIWTGIILNSEESPLVSKQYILDAKLDYGENTDEYRVRVLGLPPILGFQNLIGFDLINEGKKRILRAEDYNFAPKLLGVDVAWEGNDSSCLFMRQGLYSEMLFKEKNIDTADLAGRIMEFDKQYNFDAVFVDAGWGSGVIDQLRRLGMEKIIVVYFNAASTMKECKNKRTQMWFQIRDWLKAGGRIPDDDMLGQELGNVQKNYDDKTGKAILEPKAKTKGRVGHSPDMGDALAMTFAYPVEKNIAGYNNYATIQAEYDVLRRKKRRRY